MIDELDLPICDVPRAEPPRLTLEEYDRWINENRRTLRIAEWRERLDAQASRKPVAQRFRLA